MRESSRGFTLIELLVVIAIIAILAAIVFPILESAKAKAKQTECASNIRQIVTAATNYADDWNSRLPGLNAFGDLQEGRFDQSSRTIRPLTWRGPLWKYLKTRAIFVCPLDLQHRKEANLNSGLGGFNYTYAVNSYMTLASVDRTLACIAGPPMSKSANPTRTIFIVDENTDPNRAYGLDDAHFSSGNSTCDRHPGAVGVSGYSTVSGHAMVGYLDTHVGPVPGLVLWNSKLGQELFLH
jgi:prepilin-type N-terminal cleavage/methylation domain-containing protein